MSSLPPPSPLRIGPRSRAMLKGIIATVGLIGGAAVLRIAVTEAVPIGQALASLSIMAITLIAWRLLAQGQDRLAVSLFLWGLLVTLLAQAAVTAGVRTPALVGVIPAMLMAAWLLGPRHGYAFATVSVLFLLGMGAAQEWAGLDYDTLRTPLNTALVITVSIVATALFGIISSSELRAENARNVALSRSLQAELDEHQRQERRFQQLFLGNPAPSQIGTAAGEILAVNDAWVATFGIPREQALGRTTGELQLWEDLGALKETSRQLASARQILAQPARLRVADGSVRQFLLTMSLIEGADTPLYVASVIDQTDRLAAEAAQRQLNAELEARVAERTAELSATIQRLGETQEELIHFEKLASLGALVAGISHELNTPIGNAVTVASGLRERFSAMTADLAAGTLKRSALEQFVSDGAHMTALVERSTLRAAELVASFKQVAVDQTSEQRRRFDLQTLAEDIVSTVRPSFKHAPWKIEIAVPAGLACDSYPGPLGQVLTNLIQNAVTHAFEGRTTGTITIAAVDVGGVIHMTVSDDGLGMDPHVRAHAFDPFFTTKLGQGGSGLGLAICHRIVTSVLGGTLELSSTPGAGSTFIMRFPKEAPGRV